MCGPSAIITVDRLPARYARDHKVVAAPTWSRGTTTGPVTSAARDGHPRCSSDLPGRGGRSAGRQDLASSQGQENLPATGWRDVAEQLDEDPERRGDQRTVRCGTEYGNRRGPAGYSDLLSPDMRRRLGNSTRFSASHRVSQTPCHTGLQCGWAEFVTRGWISYPFDSRVRAGSGGRVWSGSTVR
jgi:hypothetical protein